MKAVYINGMGSVSVQEPHTFEFLTEEISEIKSVNYAKHPSYKELIPAGMIRRMANGVKMGIFAGQQALNEALIEIPDAIITGTGMGCLQDSEKFLRAIIENKEEFLTPTSFIQSTHNTVGSQIALRLGCKGYNFTYVNGGNSFENALLDAKLLIENDEENTVLVGGIDEISDYTLSLLKKISLVKKESDVIDFKEPQSTGVPFGEGSHFLALSNQKTEESYAIVKDVLVLNKINESDFIQVLTEFLNQNNLHISNIDGLIIGRNSDTNFNTNYEILENVFEETPQIYYKHFSAEYDTASAFGALVAASILKNQKIPTSLSWNSKTKTSFEYILTYNQYLNKDHSFVLFQKC